MQTQLNMLHAQSGDEDEFGFDDVVGLTTVDDDGRTPLKEQRAAAEARATKIITEHGVSYRWTDQCNITEWEHVALKGAELDALELERQVDLFENFGQIRPVIVRATGDTSDRFEAVTNAWTIAVAAELGRRHHGVVNIKVEVRDLTDEQAFELVGQELETGPEVSSYHRGLFYAAAVERFGSEAEAAKACNTTKSTVSKNLDVIRAVEVLGDKIEVRRDVSQRDAMWLMSVVGREGEGRDVDDSRVTVLAAIRKLERGPAKKIFAALRAALRVEKPRRGETVLALGDREIGRLRQKHKNGPMRIDLSADAVEFELQIVLDLIYDALATARREAF